MHWADALFAEITEFVRGQGDLGVASVLSCPWPEMKAVVEDLGGRGEEVRAVVNRFRARHPYPPGWIPFEPLCLTCRRIGKARALKVNDRTSVTYECECGGRGESPIEQGKL